MGLSRGLSKVKNFLNLIEVPAILLLVWGASHTLDCSPSFCAVAGKSMEQFH